MKRVPLSFENIVVIKNSYEFGSRASQILRQTADILGISRYISLFLFVWLCFISNGKCRAWSQSLASTAALAARLRIDFRSQPCRLFNCFLASKNNKKQFVVEGNWTFNAPVLGESFYQANKEAHRLRRGFCLEVCRQSIFVA